MRRKNKVVAAARKGKVHMRKRVFPLQDEESSGASSSTDVQHKII
jgi:hypothetical protein